MEVSQNRLSFSKFNGCLCTPPPPPPINDQNPLNWREKFYRLLLRHLCAPAMLLSIHPDKNYVGSLLTCEK